MLVQRTSFFLIITFALLLYSCKSDDFTNTAPQINNQTFVIDENSDNGTIVGTVQSSDVDVDQTLSFDIIMGNNDNAFVIDATGQISVANSEALDFEQTTSFQFTVQVMDDFSMPGSAQAEITIDLNDITIASSGLVAHFPFNGNANDESVNANDGDVQGPTLVADRNGKQNSAYSFDGTDDYIELGNSNVFALGEYSNFTVSFWVKPQSGANGTTTSIFSKYIAASDNRYYAFLYRPDNNLSFSIYENGSTTLERSESSISDTEWYNVTWVFSNGSSEMFNNGISVGTTVFTFPLKTGPTTANGVIGAFHQFTTLYSGNFVGIIDDLRIYDRSLSPDEVEVIYLEPN